MVIGVILCAFVLSESAFAAQESSTVLFEQVCGKCHSLERASSRARTKTGWNRTVTRMTEKMVTLGYSDVSQGDAQQIVDYLHSNHGYKSSGINRAEERRQELLEKVTSSEAQLSTAEERRQKLLEKVTSSKAQLSKAEERRQKLLEKFTPTKARTVSVGAKTVRP